MDTTTVAADDSPRFLTISQTSSRLLIGLPTVHQLFNNGTLRKVKLGTKTLVPLCDIERIESTLLTAGRMTLCGELAA